MKKKQNKTKKVKIQEQHKLLLKTISENIRKGMSMGEAMLSVGYSVAYSKSTNHLKETESWQELMKTHLPDTLLAEKHKQILNKTEILVVDKKIVKTGQPHSDVKYGVEMGYKLKGKFEPETLNLKFGAYNKDQLLDLLVGKLHKK